MYFASKQLYFQIKLLSLLSSSKNLDSMTICNVCPQAKQHRLPFPHSSIKSISIFDLIHVDTWGPYHTMTNEGFRFFLTIVDDFSRSTWTFLLKTKRDASYTLKHFVQMIETQFQIRIKKIRTDNAFELGSSHDLKKNFCRKRNHSSNYMYLHSTTKWSS